MDEKILSGAINKAIASGAVPAPPVEALGADVSFVRTQTDVGIELAVFETFVADLRADEDMAAFDEMFANVPHGGGVSVGLPSIARLLLARAVVANDVEGTVRSFGTSLRENATTGTAVMAISGIKAEAPINLGPDVTVAPMSSLPPSTQRGMALGQNSFGGLGPRFAISHALTTRFKFGPVFYKPRTPQPPEDMSAHIPTSAAKLLLEEACDLLAAVGVYPMRQMYWVQPDDWLMSSGITAGWQTSPGGDHFGREAEVAKDEVEELGAAYFALDPKRRGKMLRIPLDRLGRAGREYDFADRAIDLGIALESLLLHDLSDRGELGFRLSLRGAWLLGGSDADRLEIQKALKSIYDLRSRAVHSGAIERSAKTGKIISRGTEICLSLAREIIARKCEVDWQKVVVGG